MRFCNRYIIFLGLLILAACSKSMDNVSLSDNYPHIYPDYINVTVPPNIAPLNFIIRDSCDKVKVKLEGRNYSIMVRSGSKVMIPAKRWRILLQKSIGDSISVTVTTQFRDTRRSYKPFGIRVSSDSIDPYLSYRLIEPGYEVWNKLSIRERNLTNFDERILVDNNLTGNGCINCHTYSMQNPGLSFFHLRNSGGGTIIQKNGMIRKIDTRTDSTISAGVYGSWHPSGRYIAFSTNVIIPGFHSIRNERLEVYDTLSDIVILDIEKDLIITSRQIADRNSFETFPVFTSDGRKLLFCSAKKVKMPGKYKSAKYSLCSIGFDSEAGRPGFLLDTLISAFRTGRSVSEPKASPDGKYVLYTSINYGNFPVWHEEADLHLLNLGTMVTDTLAVVNSSRADSWHSWSSNSRWFVFASKRDDGMYGKPYFAHIDKDGKASKPFLMPQKDASFYDSFMKSYNIPELSKGPAAFDPYDIERAFRGIKAEKVGYIKR